MSEEKSDYGELAPGKMIESPDRPLSDAMEQAWNNPLWNGKPDLDNLRNRFFFQRPPDQKRIDAHEAVSRLCYDLAVELVHLCPAGRNLSIMLTHLEDVRMRANAALACDSPKATPEVP